MRELAQLLLPAVRWDPTAGFAPALPAVMRGIAAGVGGFVVEGGTRDAVAELSGTIRRTAGDAPIVAIAPADLTSSSWRTRPLSVPPAAAIASLRDALVVRRVARAVAHEARLAGCNAILAPSCDVPRTPRADAFGLVAADVAAASAEWIDAAQAEGVLCFASAFPGGGAVTDVLTGIPTVRESEDALYASDLVPFRAAIDAGVAGIVVAEASYAALDTSGTPASLSRPILGRLLRTQLGYDGLAVADASLLATRLGHRVRAADLVAAGVDIVLRPVNLDVELRALIDALEHHTLDGERAHEAATRRRLRAEMAAGPVAALKDERVDDAWLDETAERTISVVRGRNVRVTTPTEVAVVATRGDQAAAAIAGFTSGLVDAGEAASSVRPVTAPSAGTRAALVVIVHPPRGISNTQQDVAALCAEARRLGRESVVVWCGHPATTPDTPGASLTIACWTPSTPMLRATGRWLLRRV
ncbi:MAG TPA: glycoside hydrolase family 3 N-terminal domain-containing protein [Gemmatimonadaceae bacterium]|nr:glycoside hydrolase family 3 N-terminal domain-containing protein [Gemmatimonadaceae bacterium]